MASFTIKYKTVRRYLSSKNEKLLKKILSPKFSGIKISSTFRPKPHEAQTILDNIKKHGFIHQLQTYSDKGDAGLMAYFIDLTKRYTKEFESIYKTIYKEKKLKLPPQRAQTIVKNMKQIERTVYLLIGKKNKLGFKANECSKAERIYRDASQTMRLQKNISSVIILSIQG